MTPSPPLYLDQINAHAAAILYALVREAGSPYHPPHGTVLQLHVNKETWHKARTWYTDFTLSPYPPPTTPDDDDTPQPITPEALDFLAEQLHDAYEAAATQNGWPTNPDSRTTWSQLPTANQNTMRQALTVMLQHMGIQVTQPEQPADISGIIPA